MINIFLLSFYFTSVFCNYNNCTYEALSSGFGDSRKYINKDYFKNFLNQNLDSLEGVFYHKKKTG
jgi:hypothetical protein